MLARVGEDEAAEDAVRDHGGDGADEEGDGGGFEACVMLVSIRSLSSHLISSLLCI